MGGIQRVYAEVRICALVSAATECDVAETERFCGYGVAERMRFGVEIDAPGEVVVVCGEFGGDAAGDGAVGGEDVRGFFEGVLVVEAGVKC